MKQPVLILLKPECLAKAILGDVITRLLGTKLDLIAVKVVNVSRQLAETHYSHLQRQPFFEKMIGYVIGEYHDRKPLVAMVLWGDQAIKKCRTLAGATNPEEADPVSIRGALGRITSQGIFENIIHVSESPKEANREIKLWFEPEEFLREVFPTKKKIFKNYSKRVWI